MHLADNADLYLRRRHWPQLPFHAIRHAANDIEPKCNDDTGLAHIMPIFFQIFSRSARSSIDEHSLFIADATIIDFRDVAADAIEDNDINTRAQSASSPQLR